MDVKTILIILTISLCFISLNSMILTQADESLINKLCAATSAPTICTNCLKSSPGSASVDETRLIDIYLVCTGNDMARLFQDTLRYQQSVASPTVKGALSYCLDQFEDSKTKIAGVSTKVHGKDLDGAKEMIRDVILGKISSCTDKLQSMKITLPVDVSDEVTSVVRDWNIVVQILNVNLSVGF